MLNHFSGHHEKSLKYADQIIELKPTLAFGHFLQSISNEKLENFTELKRSLEMCLSLDSSLNLLRSKLDKLNELKDINVLNNKKSTVNRRRNKRGSDGALIDLREQPCLSNSLRSIFLKNKLLEMKTNKSEELEKIGKHKYRKKQTLCSDQYSDFFHHLTIVVKNIFL